MKETWKEKVECKTKRESKERGKTMKEYAKMQCFSQKR